MTAGIRSGTSNDGYIQVNGSDVITALSSGNVGIGNTSPSTKLHVTGDITATNFIGNISGTPEFSGDLSIADKIIHTGDTNTAIRFPAADTFSVETAGQQNVQVNGTRTLLKSPSGTNTTVRLQHQGNSGYGDIILDRTVNAFIIDNDPSNASNNQSYFSVKNKGTENLRILHDGKVGIGTNPSRRFHVKSAGANATQIALLDNDSSNEVWRVGQQSDGDGFMQLLTDEGSSNVHFDASGNNYVNGGNFGIGVTSPGEKLVVDAGSSYGVATFNSTHANGILINLQRSGTNRGFIGSGKNVADATGGVDDIGIRSQSNLIFTAGGGTERLRITSAGHLQLQGGTVYGDDSATATFKLQSTSGNSNHARIEIGAIQSSDNGGIHFYTAGSSAATRYMTLKGGGNLGIGVDNPTDVLTVYRSNTGNPTGITIRNTNTSNYSHGRLRIESQNAAKYTDIWTDVPNDCCRIGYNTSSSLNINNGNAYAKTSVSSWHNDYRVFQAGQASLSGKNPQDGSPLYLSNNAYYDTTNSRWEFISSDDASQIAMDNGSIHFKNGGTGSANGAITWSTNATFTQSGHLRMGSGKGIDFHNYGAGSGISSNLFDDYEEGTWTPSINYLGNHTQNLVFGKYTKIGRTVVAMFRYQWTGRSTTNGAYGVQITLPFTAANDNMAGHGSCGVEGVQAGNSQSSSFQSNRTSYHSSCSPNSNLLTFRCSGTNVSENSFDGSISTSLSSGYFRGVVTYHVS